MEDVTEERFWWEGGMTLSPLCTQTLFKEKEEQGNLLICLEGCLTILQTDFVHSVQEVE